RANLLYAIYVRKSNQLGLSICLLKSSDGKTPSSSRCKVIQILFQSMLYVAKHEICLPFFAHV
ncbi:MAG: hypothetical protein ACRDCS_03710, partial [Tannerellaceae bacterium]